MCKIGWILTWLVTFVMSLQAAPAGNTLFCVEYFYADNGMVTGRKVNGDMQHYRYDKRGQLLSVTDANGKILECYNYDLAGNILTKTIDGQTTTYTYDAANQLVVSTVDGRTTRYEYDAAGRLIKEGEKEYKYGYLDKILAVQENGRTVAAFDYHVGGQIARAATEAGTESYLWDGLALIRRDETNLVNEPYVTGGNPIVSGDAVLFNDMLGSTLGIKGQQNTRISMTAFGETSDPDAYFTGKPQIGELGYAFLFRNYRSDQGKWQTQDPLGYPDGWNNFAYVNNGVTDAIDWLGGKVVAKGGAQYTNFVNDIVSASSKSQTVAGKAINDLINAPGGGVMDRDSTVVRESNLWPGTSADNLGGTGANVGSGLYNYQYTAENGSTITRDPAFALLHELLHAYDINISGQTPLPGGDPDRETEINRQVAELMNDAAVRNALQDILNRNPPNGTFVKGVGVE